MSSGIRRSDHISRVHHLPQKNHSTHITDRQVFFGGGAANIAAGIATLGETVTLHSCVGDDFAGSDYEKWMDKVGIQRQFSRYPAPIRRLRSCLRMKPATR